MSSVTKPEGETESAPTVEPSGSPEGAKPSESASLDRGFSPVACTSGPSKSWVGGAVVAGVVALVVAVQVPRSEVRGAVTAERARAGRGEAPAVGELPDAAPEAKARAEAGAAGEVAAAPNALAQDALAQEVALQLQRQALQDAEARHRRAAERQRSPIVLFDQATPKGARAGTSSRPGAARRRAEEDRLDLLQPGASEGAELGREERFAKRAALEPVETVRAERVEHPSTLVPQGTFIQGVLETEISSDLPGMIRALVSSPVRAFDGSLVVPAGSRLIGRYQSGLVRGQTRVFVIWTRLLRPDGVSMRIDSPGTDVLGRAGVSGDVDTHFFEIFGSSILLSLLDGGLDVAKARAQSGDSTIIQTGGQDLNRAAEIALQNRITVAPTIRVPRGTQIQVVVSKDLDFAGADPRMD